MRLRPLVVLLVSCAVASCSRYASVPAECRPVQSQARAAITGERGVISGAVVDAENGAVVQNLALALVGLGEPQRSDTLGRFQFEGLAPGSYVLVSDSSVYAPIHDTLRLAAGQGATLRVRVRTRRNPLLNCPFFQQ